MAAVTVEQRRSIITCEMPGEHTPESPPTLQDIAADRDWWLRDAGAHYRELAAWLRERAARCRLSKLRSELLNLARRYERRAEQLERKARLRFPRAALSMSEKRHAAALERTKETNSAMGAALTIADPRRGSPPARSPVSYSVEALKSFFHAAPSVQKTAKAVDWTG